MKLLCASGIPYQAHDFQLNSPGLLVETIISLKNIWINIENIKLPKAIFKRPKLFSISG
jgi:hypothetical protein